MNKRINTRKSGIHFFFVESDEQGVFIKNKRSFMQSNDLIFFLHC